MADVRPGRIARERVTCVSLFQTFLHTYSIRPQRACIVLIKLHHVHLWHDIKRGCITTYEDSHPLTRLRNILSYSLEESTLVVLFLKTSLIYFSDKKPRLLKYFNNYST